MKGKNKQRNLNEVWRVCQKLCILEVYFKPLFPSSFMQKYIDYLLQDLYAAKMNIPEAVNAY
ncbi:MAG: hypothetical protein ACPGVB_07880, partial [Chitinophagales bacterium]